MKKAEKSENFNIIKIYQDQWWLFDQAAAEAKALSILPTPREGELLDRSSEPEAELERSFECLGTGQKVQKIHDWLVVWLP